MESGEAGPPGSGQLELRVGSACGTTSSWDPRAGAALSVLLPRPPGLLLAACWHRPALHLHLHRELPPGVGGGEGWLCLLPGLCVPLPAGW